MSECIAPRAKVNDSFSSEILDALDVDRPCEPSAEDRRDWELHEGHMQMLAEEGVEPPGGLGTFGLPSDESDYF